MSIFEFIVGKNLLSVIYAIKSSRLLEIKRIMSVDTRMKNPMNVIFVCNATLEGTYSQLTLKPSMILN